MAGSIATLVALFGISAGMIGVVEANAFLKAHPASHQERISEEDIQTSLLAEVEGTFGAGSASSRLKQLEVTLTPMFSALPKNEQGYLGRATVRYALHRLFVQRHGWFIKGLHEYGGHRNSTSTAGMLKEQVPAYVQNLFEERLGGRGLGLHELAVLAATIEHLVHNEAIKRLGDAFKVHDYLPTSVMNESEVDEVLDTYMTGYILGEDLSNMTSQDALDAKNEMPEIFMAWSSTQEFVRRVRKNITEIESNAEQQASGVFDFSLVARVAERVGEQFGNFQNHECRQIKSSLMAIEEAGTGRVRLSDFWKPALSGEWQFSESLSYLRQLGVLDETDAQHPRVIIPNYVSSPSNCIASSSFYSVCCMDECEGLLGHLERYIAAPEATAQLIGDFVSQLSSSTVSAPRKLSESLMNRLVEIGVAHGGNLQLHGRLFAQWMHHAFPRECPYPHLAGTTNPQTPDEWLESTGEDTMATEEDIQKFLDQPHLNETKEFQVEALPWSPEEELLAHPVRARPLISTLRNIMLFAAAVPFVFSIVRSASGSQKIATKAEKFLV
jgi:hypothetical protein